MDCLIIKQEGLKEGGSMEFNEWLKVCESSGEAIVITLETEEEAESVKHIMSCGYSDTLQNYCKDEEIPLKEIDTLKDKLWTELNSRV